MLLIWVLMTKYKSLFNPINQAPMVLMSAQLPLRAPFKSRLLRPLIAPRVSVAIAQCVVDILFIHIIQPRLPYMLILAAHRFSRCLIGMLMGGAIMISGGVRL